MKKTIEMILERKVIAIVRGLKNEHMLKLAAALRAGGVGAMEVTFNQLSSDSWPDTMAAIRLISDAFGDDLLAGAGTVMTDEQARMAADSGARYIISPNTDARVIVATKGLGLVSMPGAMTPTEIAHASDLGADFVKVFPAGTLGPDYIKAVKAPISHIRLMAVGGVTEQNAQAFLRAGCVGLGVGGNLVNRDWIERGEFEKIEALAREYARVAKEA